MRGKKIITFTFNYNTDEDDIDYIKRVLNKAKVKDKSKKTDQPEEITS